MPNHKYEIDRRYPFESTDDSVCPVPDETRVTVWLEGYSYVVPASGKAASRVWSDYNGHRITSFLVHEYPEENRVVYVNVYRNHFEGNFDTRKEADAADIYVFVTRLSCQRFEFPVEKGRFDD